MIKTTTDAKVAKLLGWTQIDGLWLAPEVAHIGWLADSDIGASVSRGRLHTMRLPAFTSDLQAITSQLTAAGLIWWVGWDCTWGRGFGARVEDRIPGTYRGRIETEKGKLGIQSPAMALCLAFLDYHRGKKK